MFEKVLFSTDFSEYAKTALHCIAGFPGIRDVILFHGVEEIRSPRGGGAIPETFYRPGDLLRQEQRFLEHLKRDLRVTAVMKASSDIPGAIIATAEEHGVSLIVIGARGRSLVEGILLGSVTMGVLRRTRTSVLIMRNRVVEGLEGKRFEMFCPLILSRVLCTTDFSRSADDALTLLSRTEGVGEVILLHVVSRGESEGEIDEALRAAKDELESIRRNLAAQGLNIRTLVRIGDPALEIARTADEEDTSVIWMSSHGRGWFRELLLGNTAFTVAMHARRPVLIVRAMKGEGGGMKTPEDDFIRA
ncbi:MAG: universal stress protein [Methanomicrobiales archaeon]|nr:universal stress protein [Methanomicrobiales archaeon]MDD1655465.1 universal stress protein [Methanomicrobiales archaeon]